jgi:hypothetical protein
MHRKSIDYLSTKKSVVGIALIGSALLSACGSNKSAEPKPQATVQTTYSSPTARSYPTIGKQPLPSPTPIYKADLPKPLKPTGGSYDVANTVLLEASQGDYDEATANVASITDTKLSQLTTYTLQLIRAHAMLAVADMDPTQFKKTDLGGITDDVIRAKTEAAISCQTRSISHPDPQPYKYEYFYGYNPSTGKFSFHYGSHYNPGLPTHTNETICTVDPIIESDFATTINATESAVELHTTTYLAQYNSAS